MKYTRGQTGASTSPKPQESVPPPPPPPPAVASVALWNPVAAAVWSIVLTPAFGAYLHAKNWETLERVLHF